ncbi:MAG TPA: 50S ribosomal protein L25 [Candidatus Marinimicrobia bacterium]|nr:50S ribosomal protein L25 [Candidatus Neomarinimicrobiota bacterium]|tara:strand:- start:1198 stop:1890 length:693 start_codon:yes stop_codon:yes gene_type:complete
MSKFEKLDVDIRKEQGTSAARRTRLRGRVPAVLYHSGIEATPLSMDRKALYKALKTGQMIFEVIVEEKPQFVLLKEVQYHPVTDEVIHIDFQKVKEDEKISLEIAIRGVGESQGVKLGGILVQLLNAVTVKCKPSEIPEFLEIDVTEMEMNTNLFVKDISLPEDVEMITAEDIAVMSVQEPKEEKEEEVVLEEDGEEGDSEDSSGEEKEEKPGDDNAPEPKDDSDGENQQ